MRLHVLDLDGSITAQQALLRRHAPSVSSLQALAPCIRLSCTHRAFGAFEAAALTGMPDSGGPVATFYGSGDFHHVSLALLRRLREPFNLLVIDNHPDWMRGLPFLHCGTWLHHAARLPHVRRVFHVGGDVDFDNYYQPLAPWKLVRSGRITVIPAVRKYSRGRWANTPHEPLRVKSNVPANRSRVQALLDPLRAELASRPLYVSVDKDVMTAEDAVVNWDSGHLRLKEVTIVLEEFVAAAGGRLLGMDVVGDWSPVRVRGWMRRLFHVTMHPTQVITAKEAARRNEKTNLALLDAVERCVGIDAGYFRAPA
jgi:hypothetical protein